MRNSIPTAQGHNTSSEDDVIDLSRIFITLRAGWRSIALSFVIVVGLGLIYSLFIAVPVYTAKSVVVLDTRKPQVVDLEGMIGGMTGGSDELNTEVEVLRSRGLAAKVVDQMGLMQDSEFNATLRAPSFLKAISESIFGAKTADEAQIRARVVDAFLQSVTARNVPASFVFEISVKSEDPKKAAALADALAKLYILNQIEVKFEASEQATQWLANRVAELKADLEKAEERAKAFNSQTSLVSPEMLAGLEIQNKDLRDRVSAATKRQQLSAARLADLAAAQTEADKVRLAGDPELTRLEGGDAPAFDARYQQIVARAKLEAARDADQLAALTRSQEALELQIARQGDDLIQLQQLTREAEASGTLYEYFLSRLKETSAQQGIQTADSRVLSVAVVPTIPTAPQKKLIVTMCAILGAMIGAAIVLVGEMRKSGFRTARDLEQEMGVVVMGQVPTIPNTSRIDILKYLKDKPASGAMEAIRNLRTSVLLSNVDNPPKVIVSTSSIPGEGKTTNSLALAMNLVGTGKSVLLVEGDIRRNTLIEYFPEMRGRKGLVSLLSGKIPASEALVHNENLGLTMVMGETSAINAADLFTSDAYRTFVADMRDRFDYVIIDTPPVLVVPDARIIAQLADAVLFTVKWNNTSRALVEDALRMFESGNKQVTGLILSQIDGAEMERYGYGGKYGSYGGAAYGSKYYID